MKIIGEYVVVSGDQYSEVRLTECVSGTIVDRIDYIKCNHHLVVVDDGGEAWLVRLATSELIKAKQTTKVRVVGRFMVIAR